MDNQNKMISAASVALQYIFNLNPNDRILIVTDTYSAAIAYAFEQASRANGSTVDLYKMENSKRPLKEIPMDLENLLTGKNFKNTDFRE